MVAAACASRAARARASAASAASAGSRAPSRPALRAAPRKAAAVAAEAEAVAPSPAEQVRSVLSLVREGTLSVHTASGWPLGVHCDFALDSAVAPILRVVSDEPAAEALAADARCSLHVDATHTMGCQIALRGEAVALGADEALAAEAAFAAMGLAAAASDLRRLEVDAVLYSGPHAESSWVDARSYVEAEVDPLAECAAGIVEDFNTKYAPELQGVVSANGEARESAHAREDTLTHYTHARTRTHAWSRGGTACGALTRSTHTHSHAPHVPGGAPMGSTGVMTWIDKLGFDMSIRYPEGPDGSEGAVRAVRIPFDRPVIDETDARSAVTMMTHLAWKRGAR